MYDEGFVDKAIVHALSLWVSSVANRSTRKGYFVWNFLFEEGFSSCERITKTTRYNNFVDKICYVLPQDVIRL